MKIIKNNLLINIFFSLKSLIFNLSLHLGHSKKKWNKIFQLFIFSYRNNIIIFKFDYLYFFFKKSIIFSNYLLINRAKFLFLSNFINKGIRALNGYILKKYRIYKKHAFYDGFYVGGLISNIVNIKKRINKNRLKKKFIFIKKIFNKRLPSFIVNSSSNHFYFSFKESSNIGVPMTALIDSDLNYLNCLYPIIGNNDSVIITFYFSFIFYIQTKISFRQRKLIFLKLYFRLVKFFLKFYLIYLFIYFFIFRFLNNKKTYLKKKNLLKFNYIKLKKKKNFFFFKYKNSFDKFFYPYLHKKVVLQQYQNRYIFYDIETLFEEKINYLFFYLDSINLSLLFNKILVKKYNFLFNSNILKKIYSFKLFFFFFFFRKLRKTFFILEDPIEDLEQEFFFTVLNTFFEKIQDFLIKLKFKKFFKLLKIFKFNLYRFKKYRIKNYFFFRKLAFLFIKKKRLKKFKLKFIKKNFFFKKIKKFSKFKNFLFFKIAIKRIRFYIKNYFYKKIFRSEKYFEFLPAYTKDQLEIFVFQYISLEKFYDIVDQTFYDYFELLNLEKISYIKFFRSTLKDNDSDFFKVLYNKKVYLICLSILKKFYKPKIYNKFILFNYKKYYKTLKFFFFRDKFFIKKKPFLKIKDLYYYQQRAFYRSNKRKIRNKTRKYKKFYNKAHFFFNLLNIIIQDYHFKYLGIFSNFIFIKFKKYFNKLEVFHDEELGIFRKRLLKYLLVLLNYFKIKYKKNKIKKKKSHIYYALLLYLQKNIKKRGYYQLHKYYRKKLLFLFSSKKFINYVFARVRYYYYYSNQNYYFNIKDGTHREALKKIKKFIYINTSKTYYKKFNYFSKIMNFFLRRKVSKKRKFFYRLRFYLAYFFNTKFLTNIYQKLKRLLYIKLFLLKKKKISYNIDSFKFLKLLTLMVNYRFFKKYRSVRIIRFKYFFLKFFKLLKLKKYFFNFNNLKNFNYNVKFHTKNLYILYKHRFKKYFYISNYFYRYKKYSLKNGKIYKTYNPFKKKLMRLLFFFLKKKKTYFNFKRYKKNKKFIYKLKKKFFFMLLLKKKIKEKKSRFGFRKKRIFKLNFLKFYKLFLNRYNIAYKKKKLLKFNMNFNKKKFKKFSRFTNNKFKFNKNLNKKSRRYFNNKLNFTKFSLNKKKKYLNNNNRSYINNKFRFNKSFKRKFNKIKK